MVIPFVVDEPRTDRAASMRPMIAQNRFDFIGECP